MSKNEFIKEKGKLKKNSQNISISKNRGDYYYGKAHYSLEEYLLFFKTTNDVKVLASPSFKDSIRFDDFESDDYSFNLYWEYSKGKNLKSSLYIDNQKISFDHSDDMIFEVLAILKSDNSKHLLKFEFIGDLINEPIFFSTVDKELKKMITIDTLHTINLNLDICEVKPENTSVCIYTEE